MDTHTAYKKLVNSGMPEKQAESIVEIQAMLFYHNLATKDDLAATKADISAIKVDLVAMKIELVKWIFGINLAIATLLVAIHKFL